MFEHVEVRPQIAYMYKEGSSAVTEWTRTLNSSICVQFKGVTTIAYSPKIFGLLWNLNIILYNCLLLVTKCKILCKKLKL